MKREILTMHISDQKKRLREAVSERIRRMRTVDKEAEGRSIAKQILRELEKSNAAVCTYLPLPDEADIRLVLTTLLEQKRTVYLPVFQHNELIFRQCNTVEELEPGPLNIPQPPRTNATLDDTTSIIVLVPGRAFDATGGRLGRGNGGYDIWLQKQRASGRAIEAWGIALDCQLVSPPMELEPHDQKMDRILTGRESIECN